MELFTNSPRTRAMDPATPVHSPHHSVHSSASSRLSVRNLTLHEYRKQQNSPASQATPPGRTLRRKAAASGLKEIERVPSLSRTPLSTSRVPPRPLHISQSTHSLYTYQQLPPSPPHQQHDLAAEELFRSQSAEPTLLYSSGGKVRKFKPIKRLPKPLSSGHGPLPISPAPLASVTSNQPRLSPLRTTSTPSAENPILNASQSTPSSFSLSRFPQPPNLVNSPLLPLSNENGPPRVNTTSFTSTAPVTPPATPAVIHYRGASFDLVNPHSSLVLDNIVTPSRDLDSSDYLPLRSSEDPLEFSEMAPKRPLYGDISSAYASIITRNGDKHPAPLDLALPLPPTPVAQSPGSVTFESPISSPGLSYTKPKSANDSRFSLKQLTRSLTNRFSKTPDKLHEEELHEFSESRVSLASASFVGEFPRPLERSYRAVTPKSATFPDEPITPVSPLEQTSHLSALRALSPVERSRDPAQRVVPAPLSSMIPDSPSIELGRAESDHLYTSDAIPTARPYYDDISSLYPSSSIYTNESRRQSGLMQKRSSNRKSNLYSLRTSEDAELLANEYKSDIPPFHMSSQRTSRQIPYSLEQDLLHRSPPPESDKTDTISKLIDQCKGVNGRNTSQAVLNGTSGEVNDALNFSLNATHTAESVEQPDSQLDLPASHFKARTKETSHMSSGVEGVKNFVLAPPPGIPPSIRAPLAPAFEYDEAFESPKRSDLSSKTPSYGDTRQLLQMSSQCVGFDGVPVHQNLKSSSSYSQPGISSSPQTPRGGMQQETGKIPAIWSKRVSSHNLSRSKGNGNPQEEIQEQHLCDLANYEDEVDLADWETVGHGSQGRGLRVSVGESLADYSSSEGSHASRDSMGFSGSFPVYEESTQELGATHYQHPDSLRKCSNPFTSSSPPRSVGATMPRLAIDHRESLMSSSPPASSTVPAFYGRSYDMDLWPGSPQQAQFPLVPWANPYAFSEKETQELLASGPNEDILYENEKVVDIYDTHDSQEESSPMQLPTAAVATSTTLDSNFGSPISRENTFSKLTLVGPKGNLTGTPHGTGMHDAGSSVADNSSPGAILDSSPLSSPVGQPTGYRMFKSAVTRNATGHPEAADYFAVRMNSNASSTTPTHENARERRGTVNRSISAIHTPSTGKEPSSSQATGSPQDAARNDPGHRPKRLSLRSPIPVTPRNSHRRASRAAVPGQTKLRQMVLAPSAQTLSPDHSVSGSVMFEPPASARPSTSNTQTPLRTHASRVTLRAVFANQHSPHLLCPERAIDPEVEAERRKLSWVIFAVFCILPPTLILYRWMGDMVIVNITKNRFSHVDPKPKQIALGAGIAVNISIIAGILLPILIAHAVGSL